MSAVYSTPIRCGATDDPVRQERGLKARDDANNAREALERASQVSQLVCDPQTTRLLRQFNLFTSELAAKIGDGHPEAFSENAGEIGKWINVVLDAMRKELGDKGIPTAQPLSSAVGQSQ